MARRSLTLAALAALTLPLTAAAAPAAPGAVGGIEFMLGFPGNIETETDLGTFEGDLSTSLGLVPWVEKKLGESVGFGAEMMFVWIKGDSDDAERRLVMSPHLRLRMSFPIIDKVTFDGFIAAGGTIWTAEDNASGGFADTRFGWSLRFGFGGSYAINEVVSAFAHLGWYTSTTYGDDITASIDTVPLCLGLRGNF
ncbi:MAG: hypothetical protein R3F65_00730 [bacterium]|nr:hypothetical protein [Myxococcales bacterium]MCB9553574.1 hypothetical protein [Myxococcales bacterium]